MEATEKSPPFSVEAERAVLGAILIDASAIGDVATILKSTDFYDPAHQAIFAARMDLYDRGQPGDFITLSDQLSRLEQLDRVGGQEYLAALVNAVPTAAHVEHYARVVERCAIMRRLIDAAGEIARIGYQAPTDIDEALDQAEQKLFQVSQRRDIARFRPVEGRSGQLLRSARLPARTSRRVGRAPVWFSRSRPTHWRFSRLRPDNHRRQAGGGEDELRSQHSEERGPELESAGRGLQP